MKQVFSVSTSLFRMLVFEKNPVNELFNFFNVSKDIPNSIKLKHNFNMIKSQ